jgi:hypothetical protein
MAYTKSRIPVGIIATAFNVYLAKGKLDFIPDSFPLLVMGGAGLYWLLVDDNIKTFAIGIFRQAESVIVHPSTGRPAIPSRLNRNRAMVSIASVVVICTFVGLVAWRFRREARQLDITGAVVGVVDSPGRLSSARTDLALPDSVWASIVQLTSKISRKLNFCYTASFVSNDLSNDKVRQDFEDREWERTVALTKFANTDHQLIANVPTEVMLDGPKLSQQQLDDMMNHDAALYFMAVFSYRDLFGEHRLGVCIYRQGIAAVVLLCHHHNEWS